MLSLNAFHNLYLISLSKHQILNEVGDANSL